MIFLRYENFNQYLKFYPVTSFVLALQIVLYICMELVGDSRNPETLLRFGAMFGVDDISPGYWRYFASIFLHIGFEHLLFNSIALFIFAPPLEASMGRLNYIFFYLGSGFAGNVLSHMLHEGNYYAAGASGSIYGIYAAYLYLALFRKHALDQGSSKTIKIVLVIGLIHSVLSPTINLYAHLGGFIGGFVLFAAIVRFMFSRR